MCQFMSSQAVPVMDIFGRLWSVSALWQKWKEHCFSDRCISCEPLRPLYIWVNYIVVTVSFSWLVLVYNDFFFFNTHWNAFLSFLWLSVPLFLPATLHMTNVIYILMPFSKISFFCIKIFHHIPCEKSFCTLSSVWKMLQETLVLFFHLQVLAKSKMQNNKI